MYCTNNIVFLLFFCSSVIFFTPKVNAQENWQQKVNPELIKLLDNEEEAEFLIMMKEQADLSGTRALQSKNEKARHVFNQLRTTSQHSQQKLLDKLALQQVKHKNFYIVNAVFAKGNLELVQEIAMMDEVLRVSNNPHAKLEMPTPAPATQNRNAAEWGITMMQADQVWDLGFTGEDVVIGGQDTGYDWEHPALKDAYRGWFGFGEIHDYNWHDAIRELSPLHNDPDLTDESQNPCGFSSPEPCDDGSHGTHTMGTMVGVDGEDQIGVAPGAKWIACRNMERGYGSPATYIECFEWFLAPTDINDENPDPAMAPHVINNSWSCPEMEGCNPDNWAMMEQAVINLKTSGVVVVVSAGNNGNGCSSVTTPSAMFEPSFSIGATSASDQIANFSSRGPVTVDGSGRMKPNVSAPGVGVRSSIPGSGYSSFSGTSMAGPHVAGMVALIISANPNLAGQVDAIEDIIEQTAVAKTSDQDCGDINGSETPNNTYGYGRVDALAAVEMALNMSTNTTDLDQSYYSLKIYPNPIIEEMSVYLSGYNGDATFSLFNAAGQLLKTAQWNLSTFDQQTISVGELPQGVYFYRLVNGEKVSEGKVSK